MGSPDFESVALQAVALREAGHPERALALAGLGGIAGAEAMALGARDMALIGLWRRWFGAAVPCLDTCPACGRDVSFDLPLDGIAIAETPQAPGPWRCLTTRDLLDVHGLAAADARCALAAAVTGADHPGAELVAEADRWLDRHDPMAKIEIELACAFCSAHWARPFDIVEHLWTALHGAGQSLLREVHLLASAYHWSERDILALPPARRRAYIAMVSA